MQASAGIHSSQPNNATMGRPRRASDAATTARIAEQVSIHRSARRERGWEGQEQHGMKQLRNLLNPAYPLYS